MVDTGAGPLAGETVCGYIKFHDMSDSFVLMYYQVNKLISQREIFLS